MGFVKTLVGGYFTSWLIGLGSSLIMLLAAFVVSIFTDEGTIIQFMYFLYNASISIFIVITLIPVGIFLVVFIPVWNAVNDFIAPVLGMFVDPIFSTLANFTGGTYVPIATTGVQDQNFWNTITGYGEFLKSWSSFIFTEVVG